MSETWPIEAVQCWVGGRIYLHRATGDFVFVPCGDKRPVDNRKLVFVGDGLLNVKGHTQHEHELIVTNPVG